MLQRKQASRGALGFTDNLNQCLELNSERIAAMLLEIENVAWQKAGEVIAERLTCIECLEKQC